MAKTRAKSTKRKVVYKIIPAQKARTNLGQLMDHAQNDGARFVVSRDGEPAVIIMGLDDYLESGLELPEALAKLQEQARKKGLDLMSDAEIDAEVAEVRAKKRA